MERDCETDQTLSASATPEQDELRETLRRKGVDSFHCTAAPGATAEQVAAEINRVERWLENPANNLSSRLRGMAFLKHDSAHQRTEILEGGFLQPIPLTHQQKENARLGELLIEAAAMIETLSAATLSPPPALT